MNKSTATCIAVNLMPCVPMIPQQVLVMSYHGEIIANYAGKERSKIIQEDNLKSALKALLNNSSPRAVLKHFQASNLYKTEMLHLVEKELNLEVIELLKHTEIELFQGHASNNEKLLQFDWKQKEESLRNKAPFFHDILRTVLNPKQKTTNSLSCK